MVSPAIMEEMKRVFPAAELFVIYGCTEIGCMGTTFPIPRQTKVTRTYVGKPFPAVGVRVIDAHRRVVPFGVVGEIAFRGKGIARGYLDRPELTADRFVALEEGRFYRTGDMGRLHPDGNLEILGRRDFQVQVRGIRVELAGIERTVLELGLAVQCAIVAKPLEDGDVRMVAYRREARVRGARRVPPRARGGAARLHAAAPARGARGDAAHGERQARSAARSARCRSSRPRATLGPPRPTRSSARSPRRSRASSAWGSARSARRTPSSISAATRCSASSRCRRSSARQA